jgi:cytochrome c biogenesis protein CcmG/thiol:disulfide interchange protein DsbE
MQLHTRAPWLQPTKVESIEEDGAPVGRLTLSSDYETMTLDFDPATLFLRSASVVVHDGPMVTDGVELVYEYTFVVKPLEKIDGDPTAIDLEGRQHADSIQALVEVVAPERGANGTALRRGDRSPPLALPELVGGTLDIAKLRDRLIVVDFWASWCGPCRQALPELAELARWAKANDIPVEIIAVNTSEQSTTLEGRRERVGDFVKERGNQLDGLRIVLDVDGKAAKAWGVSGLPTTVILDADGRIVAVRTGFRPGEGERLKEELLDLFEGAEAPPVDEKKPVF